MRREHVLRVRGAIVLVALLLAAVSGCAALDALGLQKPGANIVGVGFQDIGLEAATLLFDVEISNPYAVPLPLVNVDYGLASRGTNFFTGKADLQGTVPALGKKTVSLPARITYMDLLFALKDIRPGALVPYEAELALGVDAPVIGLMRLPLKKEGELPVPAVPQVSIQEIKWDKLNLDEAGGTVRLNIVNPNQFPLTLSKLDYALALGDVEVARSAVARSMSLQGEGGSGTLDIPINFSPKNLGLGLFRLLAGSGSGYKFSGDFNVTTPFGPMLLPVAQGGKTLFRR